jgi:UDP-N-acetylmuramoylalanine--D-glutamate ligase
MKEQENQLKVAFSASKIAGRRSEPSVFEHSLEFVARVNQVNYINDSKATSVNDTWNSLSLMTEPTVLILGGNDRRSDFSVLRGLVGEKVKAVVCLGSEREKVFSALMSKSMVVHANTLEEAVKISSLLSRPGFTVLFSPGCPSFDAFDNYKNRGNKFKELVSILS